MYIPELLIVTRSPTKPRSILIQTEADFPVTGSRIWNGENDGPHSDKVEDEHRHERKSSRQQKMYGRRSNYTKILGN
jgi:hypothetical protein